MDTFVDFAITLAVLVVPLYCAYLIVQWIAASHSAPAAAADRDAPQDLVCRQPAASRPADPCGVPDVVAPDVLRAAG